MKNKVLTRIAPPARHRLAPRVPRRYDLEQMRNPANLPPDYPQPHAMPATEPLTVVVWKWNQPGYHSTYTAEHVNVMEAMVKRFYTTPHRFVCITDDPKGIRAETLPLWNDFSDIPNPSGRPGSLPSCYRRLKIFSPEVEKLLGPRIVSLDLDSVIVGDMRPLWNRPENFVGWKVPGMVHRVVYNGSMFMFRAGIHHRLWTEFNPHESPAAAVKAGFNGSDQGWISYRIRSKEVGWTGKDGVFSFPREVRITRRLPPNARIVMFHGKQKPWDPRLHREADWILKYWRE